jgi:hypothetical protein
MPTAKDAMKDLDLTYVEALHGVQTAILYDMHNNEEHKATEPKHLRVGVDMSKSDMLGLVSLLMDKGVITEEEYLEYIRLAANQELHMREQEWRSKLAMPQFSFR